jgi:hypothetical protein
MQTASGKQFVIPAAERPAWKALQKKFGFEPGRVAVAAKELLDRG